MSEQSNDSQNDQRRDSAALEVVKNVGDFMFDQLGTFNTEVVQLADHIDGGRFGTRVFGSIRADTSAAK